MPELPEVETVVRSLINGGMTGESIVGRSISHIELLWPRTLANKINLDTINNDLKGLQINGAARRGKYILLDAAPYCFLIHLRMSGILRVEKSAESVSEIHDRAIFQFVDGYRLVFNDTRKFGRIWITQEPEIVLKNLGIEPLSEAFDAHWLYAKLQSKKQAIKAFLLDQHQIAGIGNIYCDEALFTAGIHPLQRTDQITVEQAARLCEAIKLVLLTGIRNNGASIDWIYRGGNYQNLFQVYQKTGEACPRCACPIERIVVGQRGTHFCPHCQKVHE